MAGKWKRGRLKNQVLSSIQQGLLQSPTQSNADACELGCKKLTYYLFIFFYERLPYFYFSH